MYGVQIFSLLYKSDFLNMDSKASILSWLAIFVSVLFIVSCTMDVEDRKPLVLAGIFPMSGEGGWAGGVGCYPAADMALTDVNNRSKSDLLPGYYLDLKWNDSECQPGKGITILYDLLYSPPQKIMLLGPGCSTVTTTIAEAAKMWNLIVMSYGSSSPALSDRKRFTTFFRTHPSANLNNPAYVKLFQHYKWEKISIIHEAEELFGSNVEDLELLCKKAKIEIVTRQLFLNDPAEAVKSLNRSDARIIVGLFYETPARKVFCEVYKNNLYGKRVVWLIIGWYADNWYEEYDPSINCTIAELRTALEGHLTAESLIKNMNNVTTLSGLSTEAFFEKLKPRLKGKSPMHTPGYVESPLAYDAVWAIAMAFNLTIKELAKRGKLLEDFTYSDEETRSVLYSAMQNTTFEGVSGRVSFTSEGDRVTKTLLEQMQDGKYKTLGYFNPYTELIEWDPNFKEKWVGGRPPKHETLRIPQIRRLEKFLFWSMVSLAALGILSAILCLVFNVTHRMRRLIQMSHPNINNLMLVGIILCLVTVVLLGLGSEGTGIGSIVPEIYYPWLCQARAWLLMTGFTLSYGSMFAKIWNVHRLSTSAKKESKREARKSAGRGSFRTTTFSEIRTFSSLVQTQKVESWQLYSVVAALLAVDLILLLLWALVNPMRLERHKFKAEEATDTDEDIEYEPLLEQCVSANDTIWMGIIFAYKGLFLIFGLFLAYETRSVKIKELNDSRFVGMSMYNVVVLCIITAPVTLIINHQHNAKFAFVALSIMFCCFLSMGVIFVPKVLEIYRKKHGEHHDSKKVDDSLPSREEEEKHQKLLAENDELKKQIQEKEEKIKILNERVRHRALERVRLTKEQDAQKVPNDDSSKRLIPAAVATNVTGDRHSDSALPSSTDDPSGLNSIHEL